MRKICNEKYILYYSYKFLELIFHRSRTISPTRGTTTTTEKFITTGPAGAPSGIPGLELLDKELQDVSLNFLISFIVNCLCNLI